MLFNIIKYFYIIFLCIFSISNLLHSRIRFQTSFLAMCTRERVNESIIILKQVKNKMKEEVNLDHWLLKSKFGIFEKNCLWLLLHIIPWKMHSFKFLKKTTTITISIGFQYPCFSRLSSSLVFIWIFLQKKQNNKTIFVSIKQINIIFFEFIKVYSIPSSWNLFLCVLSMKTKRILFIESL